MTENISLDKKLAVLFVTYNCEMTTFLTKITPLCKTKFVIVIDNSDNRICQNDIVSTQNLLFIKNTENTGLCKAINDGVEIARSHNIETLIYFDQDTDVDNELVEKLISSYGKASQIIDNLGVLTPYYISPNQEAYAIKSGKNISEDLSDVKETITSGMIFSIELFQKVGGLLEDLFLDFADYEFCWRLSKLGYCIVIDQSIVMSHQVGLANIKLGNRYIPTSAPIRNYYQMRNTIYLATRGKMLNYHEAFKNVLRRLISALIMLFFASHKISRLHYFGLGIFHGFIGNGFMGKLNYKKKL